MSPARGNMLSVMLGGPGAFANIWRPIGVMLIWTALRMATSVASIAIARENLRRLARRPAPCALALTSRLLHLAAAVLIGLRRNAFGRGVKIVSLARSITLCGHAPVDP